MAEIALRNVCKQFDSTHYGVKDFTLDIHDKEFVIFVGPSGCGKSTTLRLIAGLEDITDGELWIDEELCNYLEPKEREMSMVFQNYALYPNMTVYGNIAYSLKIRKVPKKEIAQRVREVARILEIESLLDRKPAALSGGQKQRVAIGAAIIRQPKAFLMDEPLSNLDAKLRAQMRVELQKLHKQLDTTIIYVTHDQTEAMTLGTKIVVMKDGLIQQVDTPQNIYDHPVNKFVAGFVGAPTMNFIECEVEKEFDKTVLLFATTWGYIRKFIDPQGINNRTNENDMPRLRLSDMYLIRAEALNELGKYTEACQAIDMVRERARKANGTERAYPKYIGSDRPDNIGRTLTKQEFRWLVFMERGLEFAGEQKRWFDLIRMKYDENTQMYDYIKDTFIPSRPAADVQKQGVMAARKKYFPIPFAEVSRNDGVQQNPGY